MWRATALHPTTALETVAPAPSMANTGSGQDHIPLEALDHPLAAPFSSSRSLVGSISMSPMMRPTDVLALPQRVVPAQMDAGMSSLFPKGSTPELAAAADVQNRLMRACPRSAQIERSYPD